MKPFFILTAALLLVALQAPSGHAGSCPAGALVAGRPVLLSYTFQKLDGSGEDGTNNKKIEIYRSTGIDPLTNNQTARQFWVGSGWVDQAGRAGNAMTQVPQGSVPVASLVGRFDYLWTPPAANAGEWVTINFFDDAGLTVGTSCMAFIHSVPIADTVKKIRR